MKPLLRLTLPSSFGCERSVTRGDKSAADDKQPDAVSVPADETLKRGAKYQTSLPFFFVGSCPLKLHPGQHFAVH